ncbi:MAG: tRNA 2-selenouridine(34) synthase MnmH [Bacteroidales bacterium]|nr:tRNA 2-selenouridine(34) synthase MnmH [Bacteroidales bacterium]MDD2771289.1 tRNA 2-selenouridine(34) synthase MnmH [Bacteroidales bacterium]MDD3549450.1 tRNA 2-selenouridine(34) synthase MnmH [Bacteroidales bacterium]
MTEPISVEEFLEKSRTIPVADVRTPAEYEKGHIPGAFLFPLFNNGERAEVGTLYVQEGRTAAVLKGLQLVGPRLEAMARRGLEIAGGGSLLLYCWRGGMRSQSVAWLMEKVGIRCYTLENGYKAYRNHLLGFFNNIPPTIHVLGGLTGSGKTERLLQMAAAGEQVIDLEGLANHKGSAFGNLGNPPQPSTEHFQNLLFRAFSQMDPSRPVWLEDESRNVGRCSLPDGLWEKMQQARFFLLETSREERVERLMREYGNFDPDVLETAILKIQKRLGFDQSKKAIEACHNGNIRKALEICLAYYDKAYNYQLELRKKNYGIHTFDTI